MAGGERVEWKSGLLTWAMLFIGGAIGVLAVKALL